MAKPIYYLWINKDTDMEELEKQKRKFSKAGFMVSLINNTNEDKDLKECLLKVIKNHLE